MAVISPLVRAVVRLALAGLAAAVLAGAIGLGIERARFGSDEEAAVALAQNELRERFARLAEGLASRAGWAAANSDLIRRAGRDDLAARALFVALDQQLPAQSVGTAGITIYDAAGVPLAWSGRVSDPSRERLTGPQTLFVALEALGPRLVHVEPLHDPERPTAPRLATVVAEELVDPTAGVSPIVADTFTLPTSVVDVAVRVRTGPVTARSPYAFPIHSAAGEVLVEAEVAPSGVSAARDTLRSRTRAAVLAVIALTVLLCTGPLFERRRHTRDRGVVVMTTAAVLALVLIARAILRAALEPLFMPSLASPLTLVPDALLLTLLVWLALDVIGRRRVARPRMPLLPDTMGTGVRIVAAYFIGGALAAVLLWAYERVLQSIAAHATVDLLQFSLHPLDFTRIGLVAGLVLLHAAVVWGGALLIRLPSAVWRAPRRPALHALAVGGCIAGMGAALLTIDRSSIPVPLGSFATALAVTGLAAAALSRPRGPARRASQAGRLGVLFLALVVPAAALYPSLHAFAEAAKERQVSGEFAAQAASQREDLQVRRLPHALEAIDAMPDLPALVTGSAEGAAPTTDRAYIVWSKTELARYRTTSAVELYGADGRLVSRFALNLPEYATTTYLPASCDDWELYEEPSPFGSSLRYVLRASRGICDGGRRVGGAVVRAMLDYRSLPFIASQSPYLESLRPERRTVFEEESGPAVEFVFYGWSRAPLYASGTSVWPLDDSVFDRMVASRAAFWTDVQRGRERFRVYVFNDRGGIYALGYPLIGWTGHLIKLGELVFLSAVLYTLLLAAATLFNTLTFQTPAGGRALLREIRSSFYRKLFIAFVASAVLPVVVLAIGTRTYFANQFRTGVEDAAVKTATVAQRLIEDYASLQQRGSNALNVIDDRFMVLVRRAIDQDVNLFARTRLQATSERELFANAILPSRTPGSVYRKIMLDRLPASIDVEEVGGLSYLLAAAPVRTGGLDGIVTVPQTLQRQQIEEQRDELDRRVLSASVLFVLLGSALGYWMAERIADPVNRLTRATRRIARGDLDARIAATSSDELRRLVEDFNRMAADLKQQRRELERTQRLEAWADMARQVAHDIKNPLTPIQLSAEHARRINIDRGRPLSPVLDECVAAILTQVKLLRQISTEFSSFASSPTPRPEPTDLAALVAEVIEPYRTGLTGRVAIAIAAAPDLPPVMADRTLFARALTNVIENALHAMPGGGHLAVSIRLPNVDSTTVDVEVTDTGIGMDQDALVKIFEPYFSTRATGTGLGLTIAKRNVELNGGTIAVSSERGVGTTVTLTLPLA
ncbi:MAG: HAMP domain-containing protein [Luteitalea sp.]|nr:HAMP domain-containing protein [Luteitalea sp.]